MLSQDYLLELFPRGFCDPCLDQWRGKLGNYFTHTRQGMQSAMKQATRLGGRQKPSILEVGFCKEWQIRTSAHTGCIHSQLCEEQSCTMISSSLNPLVEQPGDPLSESAQKLSDLSRGQTRFSLKSRLSDRAQPQHARRSNRIHTTSTA